MPAMSRGSQANLRRGRGIGRETSCDTAKAPYNIVGCTVPPDRPGKEGLSGVRAHSSPRYPASARSTLVALAVASMCVHALVLVVARVWTPQRALELAGEQRRAREMAVSSPLDSACVADVALATAARLVYCSTPLSGDPENCARRAMEEFRTGVLSCDQIPLELAGVADNQPVEVALVEPEVLEKIKPKPLLPLLDPADQAEFAKKLEEQAKEKHEEVKKEEITAKPVGQVVEITKPALEARPDRARYVSEYDSSVEKETVARGSTEEMIERPGPRELPPRETPVAPRPDQAPPEAEPNAIPSLERREAPGALSMREPGLQPEVKPTPPIPTQGERWGRDGPPSPDGLSPARGEQITDTARPPPDSTGRGGQGPSTAPPPVPDLRPSKELLSRVVGGGSVDKLDGVEAGDTTALNAKRWKYASFFNRMKRQVAQNWHPDQVYLRRDPRGNIYGPKDRITVLQVALKPDGSVANIYVTKASGIDFLDEEAMRAFRAAQPFPNPPGALVDREEALITFSFGFHFQIGSRRESWKIFRYR